MTPQPPPRRDEIGSPLEWMSCLGAILFIVSVILVVLKVRF